MKSPVAGRARNSSAQCCHHTATGRRCRSARSSSESCLCPRHRAVEQKLLSAESDDLTPEFTDLEDSLQTVEGIHTSLSELYILVAQDRVSPRRAAVLAYVSSLLLRSLPPVKKAAPKPPAPAVQAGNSPLGVWLTEEKEGKVRIEQCGVNLCGYSVDAKSNQNGEQVLINMKPGKDSKWSGRILDPNTGSTYDSTIALKGTDTLRVQGCAFGGMFCGGQTWTRVN